MLTADENMVSSFPSTISWLTAMRGAQMNISTCYQRFPFQTSQNPGCIISMVSMSHVTSFLPVFKNSIIEWIIHRRTDDYRCLLRYRSLTAARLGTLSGSGLFSLQVPGIMMLSAMQRKNQSEFILHLPIVKNTAS